MKIHQYIHGIWTNQYLLYIVKLIAEMYNLDIVLNTNILIIFFQ